MQKAACKAGPNRKTARAALRLCTPLCRVAGRAVRPRVRMLLLLAERSHPSKTCRRNYEGVGWLQVGANKSPVSAPSGIRSVNMTPHFM
jgi:hypothetical protein